MNTLFVSPSIIVNTYKAYFNIDVSEDFVSCADLQLTKIFISKTGLKPGKNISISILNEPPFKYEEGKISRIPLHIFIKHNWNPVTIAWKSISGSIYKISDTNIDCNDLIFWFEGLDPVLYQEQMYPGSKFPFELKDLSFDLTISHIQVDCDFRLYLNDDQKGNEANVILAIDKFISGFNDKSEKNDRKYGVIHNWKGVDKQNGILEYSLDLGSTGIFFMKKFLAFLSTMKSFKKIEIG